MRLFSAITKLPPAPRRLAEVALTPNTTLKPSEGFTLAWFLVLGKGGPSYWSSKKHVAVEAGCSRRTVQRHCKKWQAARLIEQTVGPNSYVGDRLRRPATYGILAEALENMWKSMREPWEKAKQGGPKNSAARDQGRHLRPDAPLAPHLVDAPRQRRACTEPKRPRLVLSHQDRKSLIQAFAKLRLGNTYEIDQQVGRVQLYPDDPRYRAPMSQENALIAACQKFQVAEEIAREVLKLPAKACERHPNSGLTQWGSCWECYAERHGSTNDAEPEGP